MSLCHLVVKFAGLGFRVTAKPAGWDQWAKPIMEAWLWNIFEAEPLHWEAVTKAVSIQQPWAWAIRNAGKDIENRSARIAQPGWYYLHSGTGGLTARAYESKALIMQERTGLIAPRFECVAPLASAEAPVGGIIGVFQITGWTSHSESPWFLGPLGAVIAHALPLDLIKCDGKLGAFIPRPLLA